MMLKLLWPYLIISLRIPGLSLRRTAYFLENSSLIMLPGDTQRTTNETPATNFWGQIKSLELILEFKSS